MPLVYKKTTYMAIEHKIKLKSTNGMSLKFDPMFLKKISNYWQTPARGLAILCALVLWFCFFISLYPILGFALTVAIALFAGMVVFCFVLYSHVLYANASSPRYGITLLHYVRRVIMTRTSHRANRSIVLQQYKYLG